MTSLQAIQDLRAKLEAAQLSAIEQLAAAGGEPAAENIQRIAYLHAALTAIRDEIKAHDVRVAHSETPLK